MVRLRSLFKPPEYKEPQQHYAAIYLHYLLLIGIIVDAVFLLALPALQFPNQGFVLSSLGSMLIVILLAFGLLHTRHLQSASLWVLSVVWIAFTVSAWAEGGIEIPNTAGYLVFIMMSGIIFGSTGSALATGISVITTLAILSAENNGLISFSPEILTPISAWSTYLIFFLLTGSGMFIYHNGLANALKELRESHTALETREQALQALQAELEASIEARTADLKKQTTLLQDILRVSRALAAQDTLEKLLIDATERVQEYFGYYHVGIYLLDPEGEYVTLRAASGTGRQELIKAGHRLRVGSEGIIGLVAQTGRARVALDTRADPFFIRLPELPATRSEAALPLHIGTQLLGVLDIESDLPNAFSDEDIEVLQLLADQIATTLENAQLREESQNALRRAEKAYAQISAQSWRQYQRRAPWTGFLGQGKRIIPLQTLSQLPDEIRTAISEGRVYLENDIAYLPVRVREHTIAHLRLRKKENTPWQDNELAWMQTVSDQIAQALESARLYQEAQQRATREQLLSISTARMRETLDLQSVLQTAVRELRQALGLAEAEVRLVPLERAAPGNGKAPETTPQE